MIDAQLAPCCPIFINASQSLHGTLLYLLLKLQSCRQTTGQPLFPVAGNPLPSEARLKCVQIQAQHIVYNKQCSDYPIILLEEVSIYYTSSSSSAIPLEQTVNVSTSEQFGYGRDSCYDKR